MSCRICLEEEGPFVHPCLCKGSSGDVHAECLTKWIVESGNKDCEICHHEYHKSEVCACNTHRCCREYFNYRVSREGESDILFRRFSGIIFVTSCISLLFLDLENMVIASCASTLLISTFGLAYAIRYYEHNAQLYNAAFVWKISFSVPYAISVLIFFIQYEELCEIQCVSMHQQCGEKCPVYDIFVSRNTYLLNMWLYDIGMVFGLFIIRTIMVCYFHMRKLKFQDLEGEESVPLLSDGEP